MSQIGFVGQVKDVEAFKSFTKEISGPKKADHLDACKRHGTTKERIFLAQTPMGAMINIYSEGLNAGFMMARLRNSSNAFDKFYLESIKKISGVDITAFPAGPPPHLAFEWTNGKPGKASTMIGMPAPDASKFWQFCREMSTAASRSNARSTCTTPRWWPFTSKVMIPQERWKNRSRRACPMTNGSSSAPRQFTVST
jgi:hypothetical protein